MNLLKNLYNIILSLYKYIFRLEYIKYIYNQAPMFMNTLFG